MCEREREGEREGERERDGRIIKVLSYRNFYRSQRIETFLIQRFPQMKVIIQDGKKSKQ